MVVEGQLRPTPTTVGDIPCSVIGVLDGNVVFLVLSQMQVLL